jgi:hypothetical protein
MSSIENKASVVSVPFFLRKVSDFAFFELSPSNAPFRVTVIGAKGPEAL